MDKNGLPWEENDYVKLNICVQINGLKMQQFWTDSLDDPVLLEIKASEHSPAEKPSKYLIIFNCFRNNFVQLAISLKRAAVVWQQIELNENIFL